MIISPPSIIYQEVFDVAIFVKSLVSIVIAVLAIVAMFTMFEILGRGEKNFNVERLKKYTG